MAFFGANFHWFELNQFECLEVLKLKWIADAHAYIPGISCNVFSLNTKEGDP
jgi:hypothetical protein